MCNKQQYHSSRHSYGLPAFFSFFHAVRHADGVRVLKNQGCGLEAHFVLRSIGAILLVIPAEDHRCTCILVHTISYVRGDSPSFARRAK